MTENEGLCQGEIQNRVAQRDVLLFYAEKVTSRKWLSGGATRKAPPPFMWTDSNLSEKK